MFEKIPIPVKIISISDYLSAIACFFISISFFMGYNLSELVFREFSFLGFLEIEYLFNYGIIFFLTSVFLFFLAKGLWNGKNLARFIEIFLAIFGLLIAIVFVLLGEKIFFFNIFFHGLIGGYLLFNRNVREAFY